MSSSPRVQPSLSTPPVLHVLPQHLLHPHSTLYSPPSPCRWCFHVIQSNSAAQPEHAAACHTAWHALVLLSLGSEQAEAWWGLDPGCTLADVAESLVGCRDMEAALVLVLEAAGRVAGGAGTGWGKTDWTDWMGQGLTGLVLEAAGRVAGGAGADSGNR